MTSILTRAEIAEAARAARKVGGWQELVDLARSIAAGGNRRHLIRAAISKAEAR